MKRSILFGTALACTLMGASAQDTGTLAKAKAAGAITMGVREASPPLSYSVGGSHVGYHVELCEQMLGKLLPGVTIRPMVVTPQNRLPLLQNGTIDIECGSTTNNAARQQQAAFANTTYITEARFAVRAASGIESLEQLKGKTVVTTTGTTLVQRLRRIAQDNKGMGLNIRKDDPAFKRAVDGHLAGVMASGELEKLYAKWFMAPIPPRGAVINIPLSDSLKAAFQSPNDRPAEAYEARLP